jgi:hypothetical protein
MELSGYSPPQPSAEVAFAVTSCRALDRSRARWVDDRLAWVDEVLARPVGPDVFLHGQVGAKVVGGSLGRRVDGVRARLVEAHV